MADINTCWHDGVYTLNSWRDAILSYDNADMYHALAEGDAYMLEITPDAVAVHDDLKYHLKGALNRGEAALPLFDYGVIVTSEYSYSRWGTDGRSAAEIMQLEFDARRAVHDGPLGAYFTMYLASGGGNPVDLGRVEIHHNPGENLSMEVYPHHRVTFTKLPGAVLGCVDIFSTLATLIKVLPSTPKVLTLNLSETIDTTR